jgi:hypothetical protein
VFLALIPANSGSELFSRRLRIVNGGAEGIGEGGEGGAERGPCLRYLVRLSS